MLEHCIDGSIKSAEVDESKDLEILETNWKTFSGSLVDWIGSFIHNKNKRSQ